MNHEHSAVGYDEFFPESTKERIRIFNGISTENRAFLMKTHAERWLAVNRSRLTGEQIALVEEVIRSTSPEWYRDRGNIEEINPEARALEKKMEAIFPREVLRQFATERADYIPMDRNN